MKDWLKRHCMEIKVVIATFVLMLLLVVMWTYFMYSIHTEFQIICELASALIVTLTAIIADTVLEVIKRG